jgi:hypothetical protein
VLITTANSSIILDKNRKIQFSYQIGTNYSISNKSLKRTEIKIKSKYLKQKDHFAVFADSDEACLIEVYFLTPFSQQKIERI